MMQLQRSRAPASIVCNSKPDVFVFVSLQHEGLKQMRSQKALSHALFLCLAQHQLSRPPKYGTQLVMFGCIRLRFSAWKVAAGR